MKELRIVSFLPSATELACSLGLAEFIVGISHECDYPAEICDKPVVVHSALPIETMSLGEIDVAVSAQLRAGQSLYQLDEELLRELRPTIILTQDLCQVCAPAGNEVTRALAALPYKPEILWMSPHSIADIHQDLLNLAQLTGTEARAHRLIKANHKRLRQIADSAPKDRAQPRVFCAEWIDPIYCCGHWVPEQVEIAGGIDVLGRKWKDSVRVTAQQVIDAQPEMIVVMPCGFDAEACEEQREALMRMSSLREVAAITRNAVHALDASYFSRPSLRVIDGVELLADLFSRAHLPS
jgi:iron complex transport system substrate-binding protein